MIIGCDSDQIQQFGEIVDEIAGMAVDHLLTCCRCHSDTASVSTCTLAHQDVENGVAHHQCVFGFHAKSPQCLLIRVRDGASHVPPHWH